MRIVDIEPRHAEAWRSLNVVEPESQCSAYARCDVWMELKL